MGTTEDVGGLCATGAVGTGISLTANDPRIVLDVLGTVGGQSGDPAWVTFALREVDRCRRSVIETLDELGDLDDLANLDQKIALCLTAAVQAHRERESVKSR